MKVFSFILFFILPSFVFSQEVYRGKVTDSRQQALENATVMVLQNDTMVDGTITDSHGIYRLENIRPGNYRLQVSMLGYKGEEKALVWEAGSKSLPDFVLQEDTLWLGEVSIEANRADNMSYTSNATVFHLSENALKNSMDLYEALQEIPRLVVDPSEKKITLSDGSTPLVLVNGVNRPGYLNTLDPSDIIAVELIDNPSSRYRGQESTRSVLNVRVRRKKETFTNMSLSAMQNVKAYYTTADGSLEVGNSDFSGYINVDYWFNNERNLGSQNYLESGDVTRSMSGTYPMKSHKPTVTIGGDWVISPQDYLLLDSKTDLEIGTDSPSGSGTQTVSGIPSDITSRQISDDKYVSNSTALFYRHSTDNGNIFETTGRFGYTWNSSDGWREEYSAGSSYREDVMFDNERTSYTLEMNYALNSLEKVGMNFGSNSYFQRFDVEYHEDAGQDFRYRDAREYLYGEIYGKTDSKFTYSLSLGLDMVFTRVAGIRNHYINFLPQVSFAYNFTPNSVLRLYGSRNRESPSYTNLNPYNISADSLNVDCGNPYLTPMIENRFTLRYEWNYRSFYLNPFVTYYYYTDQIESVGELQGNVYYSTYENVGNHSKLSTGLSARLRFGQVGNILANVSYTKDFYDGYPFSGNSVGYSLYLNLQRAPFYLNAFIYYAGPLYDKVGKYRYKTESAMTLSWRISPAWRIDFRLRYFMPVYNDEIWVINGDYYSYTKYNRTHLMPIFGIAYTFRSKNSAKQRQRQQLYNSEERFELKMKR